MRESCTATGKTVFQMTDFPGYSHDHARKDVSDLHQAGWVVFDGTHATLTAAGIEAIAARTANSTNRSRMTSTAI